MKKENILNVFLMIVIGVLVVVGTVQAATTISTDITTEGVLTVSGTASSTFVGAVGIGTSSPGYKLDAYGDLRVGVAGARANTLYVNTSQGPSGAIGIGTTSTSGYQMVVGNGAYGDGRVNLIGIQPLLRIQDTHAPSYLKSWILQAYESTLRLLEDDASEILTIAPGGKIGIGGSPGTAKLYVNGNLGIGTTTPVTRLHVSSGASATTTVSIGELGLSSSKSCINVKASDGSAGSFYMNAAHQLVAEANYCR